MPATAKKEETFRYQVETDQGTFELELDGPVPEGKAGMQMLEDIVADQLAGQSRNAVPLGTAPRDIGRGLVGGLRDFGQQFIDIPATVLNTITEFVSPDPPGGPRRRLVPEVQMPQLPGPGEPKSNLERGVRTGTTIAADLAALAIPIGRSVIAKRRAARIPMLFEKGSVAREMAEPRPQLRYEPRSPASRSSFGTRPSATVAEASGILKTPPSQSARNLARLFEFSADDIPKMSLERAMNARRRILTNIPDYPMYQEGTPIFELLQRLEQRILSFR